MTNQEAFEALKARVPSIQKEGADAFGNTASRNGWLAILIPKQHFVEAKKAAADLRLTLYDPICGDTYMVHRLLNTEIDRTDAFERPWSIGY